MNGDATPVPTRGSRRCIRKSSSTITGGRRNKGTLAEPTGSASLRNPLCGDEVEVQVEMHDGKVADVKFGGRGCSISQASASMMTELVKGRTPEEVHALGERFAAMIRGDTEAAKDEVLGQARALSGVSRFPTRGACAMIAWEAMARAVERSTPISGASGGAPCLQGHVIHQDRVATPLEAPRRAPIVIQPQVGERARNIRVR